MERDTTPKTGPRDEWDDYFASLGMVDPRRPQVQRTTPRPRGFGWER